MRQRSQQNLHAAVTISQQSLPLFLFTMLGLLRYSGDSMKNGEGY